MKLFFAKWNQQKMGIAFFRILGIPVLIMLTSCAKLFSTVRDASSGSDPTSIPMIAPVVNAAVPAAFGGEAGLFAGSSRSRGRGALAVPLFSYSNFETSFFTSGPTYIPDILASIDARLAEINTRALDNDPACLRNPAVAVNISVMGEVFPIYVQCYDIFSGGTGGMIFGKSNDVWYLYSNVGQVRSVASIAETSNGYQVEAFLSVGQENASSASCSNTFDGCSYAGIHFIADSSSESFEFTAGGTSIGFCGAHLKSNGTFVYGVGSEGGLGSCNSAGTACRMASDTSLMGDCTGIDASGFEINSLVLGSEGVDSYSGATSEPLALDGTISDPVHFGLSVSEMQTISGVDAF